MKKQIKKEPVQWTVLRVKRTTLAKINYYRAKQVDNVGKYMTQDETLLHLLDKRA